MIRFPLHPLNLALFALICVGVNGFLTMLCVGPGLYWAGMVVAVAGDITPFSFGAFVPAAISLTAFAGLIYYGVRFFT